MSCPKDKVKLPRPFPCSTDCPSACAIVPGSESVPPHLDEPVRAGRDHDPVRRVVVRPQDRPRVGRFNRRAWQRLTLRVQISKESTVSLQARLRGQPAPPPPRNAGSKQALPFPHPTPTPHPPRRQTQPSPRARRTRPCSGTRRSCGPGTSAGASRRLYGAPGRSSRAWWLGGCGSRPKG